MPIYGDLQVLATTIRGRVLGLILNHAVAGAVGSWIQQQLGADVLRWVLGLSFLAMAVWMLVPDKLDDDGDATSHRRFGIFGTTVIVFFLAEMGDKTQIATVALAARYDALVPVVVGTTLGMMLANAPVVLLGDKITRKIPITLVHRLAAGIFAVLGVLVLLNVGSVV